MIITLIGEMSLSSTVRDNALSEFFTAYRLIPNDPFISFSIGLTYLALVTHKRIAYLFKIYFIYLIYIMIEMMLY